jgi:hypothetical protein
MHCVSLSSLILVIYVPGLRLRLWYNGDGDRMRALRQACITIALLAIGAFYWQGWLSIDEGGMRGVLS